MGLSVFNCRIMPIEIKELHVKAVIVADQPPRSLGESINVTKLTREISEEVLRRVLQKLGQKNER